MTKHLRKCFDMIKENHIKEKDGKLFVECRPMNVALFPNDEEKEELPICENCGNEVCLYLGEAINKGDDYYCDEMCFVEYHGGIYV